MIARDYITEWRAKAPWIDDAQVEQDLVISKALADIGPLLATGYSWDIKAAATLGRSELIERLD